MFNSQDSQVSIKTGLQLFQVFTKIASLFLNQGLFAVKLSKGL